MKLLFFLLVQTTSALLMGGWQNVNITDENVLSATKFVVSQTFGISTKWTLVEAKQQLVHGTNLDLLVQIECNLHKFRVHTGHEYNNIENIC